MFTNKNISSKNYLLLDSKGRLNLGTEFKNKYLTKREIEIMKLILRGYSAKSIGLELKISYRTVETYVNGLKLKFECNRKCNLIAFIIKSKLYKILL